jgi:hypothetical protein
VSELSSGGGAGPGARLWLSSLTSVGQSQSMEVIAVTFIGLPPTDES